jgi:MSHA pilin protein MshA
MKFNKRQEGFTLIELIVVIVILGILGVVAAPKFLSMSSDARTSAVNGLKGVLISGAKLVYSQAYIDGTTSERRYTMTYNGGTIQTHSGYPAVWNNCTGFVAGLPYWVDLDLPVTCTSSEAEGDEWYGIEDWNTFYFLPAGYTSLDGNCYVTYREATEGEEGALVETTEISVTSETDGC